MIDWNFCFVLAIYFFLWGLSFALCDFCCVFLKLSWIVLQALSSPSLFLKPNKVNLFLSQQITDPDHLCLGFSFSSDFTYSFLIRVNLYSLYGTHDRLLVEFLWGREDVLLDLFSVESYRNLDKSASLWWSDKSFSQIFWVLPELSSIGSWGFQA